MSFCLLSPLARLAALRLPRRARFESSCDAKERCRCEPARLHPPRARIPAKRQAPAALDGLRVAKLRIATSANVIPFACIPLIRSQQPQVDVAVHRLRDPSAVAPARDPEQCRTGWFAAALPPAPIIQRATAYPRRITSRSYRAAMRHCQVLCYLPLALVRFVISPPSFCFRDLRRRRLQNLDHRCIPSPGHRAAAKFAARPDRHREAPFEPSYS